MNDFRERLQKAATRVGVGESQASIADALNLNRQTIHRWFSGGEPNADMLLHAARTLGVDPEWLKSGNGDMLPQPDELPADERDLLKNYRSASADARRSIQTIVRSLRKSVVTIAAAIPPLLAQNDADAAIRHNHNYAQNEGVILIACNWIMSWLRSRLFVRSAAPA
jgi:transcriptional regulator with XRE-family HTH domain